MSSSNLLLVLLSASVERVSVSRMPDFFKGYKWYEPLFWRKRKQKYWCFYPHRLRDLVSPVCGIFQHQGSGNSFRGAKGSLYWSYPTQIPSKCWGWSNLILSLFCPYGSFLVSFFKYSYGSFVLFVLDDTWLSSSCHHADWYKRLRVVPLLPLTVTQHGP